MEAYMALAALQIGGSFQSADIIRKNGDLQANINNLNAQFADLDAHNAMVAGYSNSARYADVINSTIGADKAAFASEGVSVGYGTAGSVEKDNRTAGLLNTLQMQRSAQNAAVGYESQAINIRTAGQNIQTQAGLSASSAETSGIMQGIGSMVTGYQMSNLTGRGKDKDSGTNNKAWTQVATQMNVVPGGGGMAMPSKYAGSGDELQWNSTGGQGEDPGFFGHPSQWKPMAAQGDEYASTTGNNSFTSEVG